MSSGSVAEAPGLKRLDILRKLCEALGDAPNATHQVHANKMAGTVAALLRALIRQNRDERILPSTAICTGIENGSSISDKTCVGHLIGVRVCSILLELQSTGG